MGVSQRQCFHTWVLSSDPKEGKGNLDTKSIGNRVRAKDCFFINLADWRNGGRILPGASRKECLLVKGNQ